MSALAQTRERVRGEIQEETHKREVMCNKLTQIFIRDLETHLNDPDDKILRSIGHAMKHGDNSSMFDHTAITSLSRSDMYNVMSHCPNFSKNIKFHFQDKYKENIDVTICNTADVGGFIAVFINT